MIRASAAGSSGGSSYTGPIRIAGYGDSRADNMGGSSGGPDLYDGITSRDLRVSLTNPSTFINTLPIYLNNCALVVNGGCSSTETTTWNSASRLAGRAFNLFCSLDWDVVIIQYGTNDIQNNVNSTGTRDSIATLVSTNIKNLITAILNNPLTATRKIIFQTTMQRDTSATGYNTFTVEKRDCCDYVNYGNGGAIQGVVPWIQAHAKFNTQIYIHDIQALTNVGGVSTGAYLDTANFSTDGTHLNYAGARKVAKSCATLIRSIFPYAGIFPPYRAVTGNNLIPAVNGTYVGGQTTSNCAASAITYGTDANGYPYAEVTVTPNNVAAGNYKLEFLPDVGTNGGRTPLGGTFVKDDFIVGESYITIDNGSGEAPTSVNNCAFYMYCSYIGGTPSLQTRQFGIVGQNTTGAHQEADVLAHYVNLPLRMTGDSSLIAAPSAGNGLRLYFQIYFGITNVPFRVRWTKPGAYIVS